ncbi:MAG: agmatine deiminase family protein, partial [Aureispira sp.]|nr:agmatine deiminase family protein [Aureispira sp.]
MKYIIAFLGLWSIAFHVQAQNTDLPISLTPFEELMLKGSYSDFGRAGSNAITTAPSSPVRTMAEWEEIQSLVITWQSYQLALAEIVRHARKECEVIVVCTDSTQVKNYLTNLSIPLSGVSYLIANSNSVWMRDYGANTVYTD